MVENEFIKQLQPYLLGFEQKSKDLFIFRCPFCGDSKKSKKKKRGNLYKNGGKFFYHCFNCNKNTTFYSFLKDINYNLWLEYRKQVLTDNFCLTKKDDIGNVLTKSDNKVKKISTAPEILNTLQIKTLPFSHIANQYLLVNRKIPKETLTKFFYVSPESFYTFSKEHLNIPTSEIATYYWVGWYFYSVFDKDKIIGFQLRKIEQLNETKIGGGLRYFIFKYNSNSLKNEDNNLIFNYSNCNFSKRFYVYEGVFDSLYTKNSIALTGISKYLFLLDLSEEKRKNCVIVFDNDFKYNKEVSKILLKVLSKGMSVFIAPPHLEKEFKDINELVAKQGYTSEDIQHLIDGNIYSGLKGRLELQNRKKL